MVEESDDAARKIRQAVADEMIPAYADDLFDAALQADIVTADEVALLRKTEQAVRRAIDVDDFSSDELWADRAKREAA